jgi:hypothetical protein
MSPHDHAYKLLFSHAKMVEELLRGFVHEDWVAQVDFSTLEKCNASYVTDDLRERHSDVIWRVRLRDQWLYVYLLIEFQSEVDRLMSIRIMTYLGLLYQDLARTGEVAPGQRFPPVLPIVLYNGRPRWTAPTSLADLIAPGPGKLRDYLPQLRYLLIDEGACSAESLATRNLVASLFALERCQTPQQIKETLERLIDWWHEPEQTGLRRSFTIWIGRVLLPGKVPGKYFPEFQALQEVPPMLEETVKEWVKEWKAQGLAEGRAEGWAEGRAEGERAKSLEIARLLLQRGDPPEEVARITGLSLDEIRSMTHSPPPHVSDEVAPYQANPPSEKKSEQP